MNEQEEIQMNEPVELKEPSLKKRILQDVLLCVAVNIVILSIIFGISFYSFLNDDEDDEYTLLDNYRIQYEQA